MGIFDLLEGHSNNYNQYVQDPQQHKAKLSHELIAGAASYEAMKAYEKKRKAEGDHDHSTAREMIAAIAGAEADKMIETKGLNWVDREQARRGAQQQAVQAYNERYVR